MGRKSYFAFVAALVAVFALVAAAPAEAGRGHGHGHGKGWRGGPGGPYVQNNYYGRRGGGSNINALGAGLVGLAAGAVIGSALTPKEVYVTPPARPVGYRPEPWTQDWYAYCSSRYRSFNPRSGTFVGYDGYEHFCR
ncbi:BA14K family protein [Methyloceanibacter stevinii]